MANALELAGVRFWTRRPEESRACCGKASDTVLLLAHDPRRLTEAAALDVPAVLSGHTHGGQVVLPGVGAVARRRFPVLAGLGSREEHVDFRQPGHRNRLCAGADQCPPEVAVVTLKRRQQA